MHVAFGKLGGDFKMLQKSIVQISDHVPGIPTLLLELESRDNSLIDQSVIAFMNVVAPRGAVCFLK